MVSAEEFIPVILLGIFIALVPFLTVSIYIARGRRVLWKAFLLGWVGWLIALAVRIIPVQLPQQIFASHLASNIFLSLLYGVYASAMAGLFEEGFRFIILRRRQALRVAGASILSFGLGWGVGEAIIIYVPSLIALPFLSQSVPSIFEVLPGALERNFAILAHIALTLIVLNSMTRGKIFLALAMLLHFGLNAVAISTLVLTKNIWLTELMIALVAAVLLLIAYRLYRVLRVKMIETSSS